MKIFYNKWTYLVILIILLISGVYMFSNPIKVLNTINFTSNNLTNNSITAINPCPTASPNMNNNTTNKLLPNDYIINNIKWSSYKNLQVGYIIYNDISEPNDFVNHKFIAVEIATEVNGYENSSVIKQQLAGVAREIRQLYGPNCAIGVFGMDHGVLVWPVTMRVYDDKVYGLDD